MSLRRVVSLGLMLVLAGCGGGEGPAPVFAPLTYDYLRPIRLNVATLDVEDHAVSSGDDVAAQAPVPPAQALTQMAHDRIFPGGATGRAVFVIQDASIRRHGDTLAGSLAVRLDILGPGGQAVAFAEARVARSSTTDQGDLRTREYALTRQMMDDMNVEFEFQARRALKGWLQPEGDVPAAVSVQPLSGPSGAGTAGAATAVPAAVAPGAGTPLDAGRAMSPPPGSLSLPSGYPGASAAPYPGGGAAVSPYPQAMGRRPRPTGLPRPPTRRRPRRCPTGRRRIPRSPTLPSRMPRRRTGLRRMVPRPMARPRMARHRRPRRRMLRRRTGRRRMRRRLGGSPGRFRSRSERRGARIVTSRRPGAGS